MNMKVMKLIQVIVSHSPSIFKETEDLKVQKPLFETKISPFLTIKRLKTDKKIQNPPEVI